MVHDKFEIQNNCIQVIMQPPPPLLVAPILLFILLWVFSRQRQKPQNGKKRVQNFRTKLGISGHDQNFRTFQDK